MRPAAGEQLARRRERGQLHGAAADGAAGLAVLGQQHVHAGLAGREAARLGHRQQREPPAGLAPARQHRPHVGLGRRDEAGEGGLVARLAHAPAASSTARRTNTGTMARR